MDKIRLEILGLTASRSQTGSFALVLGESYGNRRIPIVIGTCEAQAIAMEMEKIASSRPMTHDLFKSFTRSFNIEIHEINIFDLKEGIFFAKIVCSLGDGSNKQNIDARPSDAIAIGLRHNVPIYASQRVMDEAGIKLDDEESAADEKETEPATPPKPESLSSYSTSELKTMLDEAINQEEYERAAKIRDEISRRS